MFGLGIPELLVIVMLISIFLGANRLPEIGRSLSEAIRENRNKKLNEESIEEGDDFE